ncbi:DNA-directed RNA polymerase III subunit RPC5-like protein [Amazona aestiva]|uniref:DNA-directed RNA polymerase III subunit RPC5-like protein n=1 Tax=Amazona aestiva TaxID=12930 RepID=A0A0Q3XCX4_AMAAE|nr:DNA-directed RNA polymerase III subunit RPC5-like protein [Amazona aestiva]
MPLQLQMRQWVTCKMLCFAVSSTCGEMVNPGQMRRSAGGCCCHRERTAASPDELKVYALWEAGDTYDQHRQVLLEIFSKNYRVRRNVIQNQLSQECGEDLNKQEVDRVLKDCCVSYGGMWYLKGTVQS